MDGNSAQTHSDGFGMYPQSPQFEYDIQHVGLTYSPTGPNTGRREIQQMEVSPSTPGSSQFFYSPPNNPLLGSYSEYRSSPRSAWSSRAPLDRRLPWNMYIFLLFGIVCAIGHHIYYSSLNGKPADDQLLKLRYGTILAFGAKAGLCAAVVTAFRQRIWTTVRTRFLSIGAMDSLFAATEDVRALWNWELFKGAKTAMALAVFVWIAPFVVILSANTLLVEPRTLVEVTTCPGVRTLNFTFEEENEWRVPTRIDGVYEIPVSVWNTTKPPDEDPPFWFDYYTGPSPALQQTATLGAFLGGVAPRKNASLEVCGSGWNCTFDIHFVAPGYKCTELGSGLDASVSNLTQESGSIASPIGMDLLLPNGLYVYYAVTDRGEYSPVQLRNVTTGGIPKTGPPFPKDFGAFRTEPIIWVGYTVIANPDEPMPTGPSDEKWNSSFIPKIFACENYETAYTARFNYTDTTQATYITNRTFLAPVINTTFLPGVDAAHDGTDDNTTAKPHSNYIYPWDDVGRYRRVAAYHSLGSIVRSFLGGTVKVDENLVGAIANTAATPTKLLDQQHNFFARPNLQELVQSFYEDIILSLFSNPQFVDIVWAARPSEQSGTLVGAGKGTADPEAYLYPCVKSRTAIQYNYHARDLWIVYSIAISLALAAVATGAYASWGNGRTLRDTRFSTIVAATRGPSLDKVAWEDRDRPSSSAGVVGVKDMRIGYGFIPRNGVELVGLGVSNGGEDPRNRPGETRYGFGLEGEVQQAGYRGSMYRW